MLHFTKQINTNVSPPKKNTYIKRMPCLVLAETDSFSTVEIGRQYELIDAEYIISGSTDADIPLPIPATPAHRVKIFFKENKWCFENLSNRDDVYINDLLNAEGSLQDGDFLQFGQTVYEFLSGVGRRSNVFFSMLEAIRVDGHTKTFNKTHFWESISSWIALSERYKKPLSLAMLDLDDFKKINATHGHLWGDEVLKLFCHRIQSRLRKEDTLYRVGGEEFTIILPETSKAQGLKLANNLREAISQEPFLIHDQKIPVTVSIGVSSYRAKMSEEVFYHMANKKMREAKNTGKNKVVG